MHKTLFAIGAGRREFHGAVASRELREPAIGGFEQLRELRVLHAAVRYGGTAPARAAEIALRKRNPPAREPQFHARALFPSCRRPCG
jgi:hypothetical protein